VNDEELRIGRCSNAARQQQPAGGGNTFRPFLWDFDMAIVRATAKGPVKRKPTGFAMLDWTKTKQQAFLDHLAATANVTAATAKVKFKEGAAYDYRRKSPEFRTAWQGALCEGYSTIAGLRTTQLSINGESVVITNKGSGGWRELLSGAGVRSVSASGAGVFTGSTAETRVKSSALSGVLDDYELSFESGERLRGKFLVARLDYAGDFNGERSYTLSLESSGPVVSL
jgi:TP901-1 family phage major tail protein